MRVLVYTFGIGAGHLSRVNAVVKGFARSAFESAVFVYAPRSKYLAYLDRTATLVAESTLPADVDVLICDWKSDSFIESLPANYARLWIGLRRLGRIPSTFPKRFLTVAVEPGVRGDCLIWPIISTWRDELANRAEFHAITGTSEGSRVALLCENGCYERHPGQVLRSELIGEGLTGVMCSNSPHAKGLRDLDYWPVARLFPHAERIVIGAGYNSIHEAICYSKVNSVVAIHVGGDDQRLRLRKFAEWWEQSPGDSQGERLAALARSELL